MYGNQQDNAEIVPIASLNPYNTRWKIKARVTSKSDLRSYVNQRGEGKLFSIELLDSEGTAIKATFFNKAVDNFFDYLVVGNIYTFSGGRKGTNRVTQEGELTFDERSEIAQVANDTTIKSNFYGHFTKISKIQELAAESKCDVLGVVTNVKPAQELRSKAGRDLVKRDITIVDDTLTSIDLTLWGEQADQHNEAFLSGQPVVAVRGCRVSDFSGRSLSTTFDGKLFVNPEFAEAQALHQWYGSVGASSTVETLSVRSGGGGGGPGRDIVGFLSDIRDDDIINGSIQGGMQYVSARVWTSYLRYTDGARHPWYTACPSQGCNKKVERDDSAGTYWCEKCRKNYDTCEYRYMLSFAVADSTGSRFVSAFNEEAALVLGMTAGELKAAADTDERAIHRAYAAAQFKHWEVRLRAKAETGQDDNTQVRAQVMRLAPVDYRKETRNLLSAIALY